MKIIFLEVKTKQAKEFLDKIQNKPSKYKPQFLMVGAQPETKNEKTHLHLHFNLGISDRDGVIQRMNFPTNVLAFQIASKENQRLLAFESSDDLIQICLEDDFYEPQVLDYFKNDLQLKRVFSLSI